MDQSILQEIGLSNAEIKIYIALLELGTTTAGPIIKKSGLQNSVVHMTLGKLVDKGLISFVLMGKTKHYSATDPKNIINFIEEKKRKFETILPELLAKQSQKEESTAKVYEGFKGFKNACYELIRDAKPGEEYLFFAFYTENADNYEMLFDFYAQFEKDREAKGLLLKGISPIELKETLKARNQENLKYVEYPTIQNTTIFRDFVMFTPLWDEKQTTFVLKSRPLAESLRIYFNSIWLSN